MAYGPWRGFARLCRLLDLQDADFLVPEPCTRRAPGGSERVVVAGAHEVVDAPRGGIPIDAPALRHLAAEIAPHSLILRFSGERGGIAGEHFEKPRDELHPFLRATQRHAQSGVLRLDRKAFLEDHRAGIDARLHAMHGDAMALFPVVDGPARRVEPGVTRKRTGMQVVGSEPGHL